MKGIEKRISTGNYTEKQYPDIGPGMGVMYGQSVDPGAQGGQALPEKPLEPTATIDPGEGAGTEPTDKTYPYPPNPAPMQGAGDRPEAEVIMPKLQATGDPASTYGIQPDTREQDALSTLAGLSGVSMQDAVRRFGVRLNDSSTIPGMDRTAVGDKWKYEYDMQHYTEQGIPYLQANVPAHWDLLDSAFGSRGFVRNEIAAGLDKRRFENKLTGDYAEACATPDGTIGVQVFDRTGAVKQNIGDFATLQMFLQQVYPIPGEDMIKSMEFDGRIEGLDALRRRSEEIKTLLQDTHAHYAGEFPSKRAGQALSAIHAKMLQGHDGATVFLNQNPGVAVDGYSPSDASAWQGAVGNYPPDSYVVARTNYDFAQASADPVAMDKLSQEVQGNPNVHDLTVGAWKGQDGKTYVDYGVVVSGRANALKMAGQWKQQGIFQVKDAQGKVAANYLDTQQEESYNVGSQGISAMPYPPLAQMKPGYEAPPPVGTHAHFAGEFPSRRQPSQRTSSDPNLYSNLRSRGMNDAKTRHVMQLMTSTGLSADQLAMHGFVAMPQLSEDVPTLEDEGNEILNPDGTISQGRAGQALYTSLKRVGLALSKSTHAHYAGEFGTNIEEADGKLKAQGFEDAGWGRSNYPGAMHTHTYMHEDGRFYNLHTDRAGNILGIDRHGKE